MMKFWRIFILLLMGSIQTSYATESASMVQVENYFNTPLTSVGWPDYPPFSRYVRSQDPTKSAQLVLESALLKPTVEVMQKYGINVVPQNLPDEQIDTKLLLLDVRSGKYKLFFGAYSNTGLYNGLQMIFPASIANPIHLITTPENVSKIKSVEDLKNLRGIASRTEQLSDFITRKIGELGIEYVDTPYEGYEKLILEQADYMVGGLYYNRMMASHYGLGSFLSYSQKPLFKIPVFIAISKVTPRLSQYMEAFHEEFTKPEYADAVKQEILRMVSEEEQLYEGTVPPSFVRHDDEGTAEEFLEVEDNLTAPAGYVIEHKVEEKSIDDVLEGI